jgi:hypothetical protein
MSSKGSQDLGETDDMPLEPESVATMQEAVPVPFLAGTRAIALRWISPPVSVFSVQAKDERPGKK